MTSLEMEARAILEMQDAAEGILSIVAQLPSMVIENWALAENAVRQVRVRYANAIARAPFHDLVAQLPGNAQLASGLGPAQSSPHGARLLDRLKSAVVSAAASRFPDIARIAVGADAALMMASKMRRERDRIDADLGSFVINASPSEIPAPMKRIRAELLKPESERMSALARQFDGGGLPDDILAPLAFEALHDVVFSQTLDEPGKAEFEEFSRDDVDATVCTAERSFETMPNIATRYARTLALNLVSPERRDETPRAACVA